MSDYIHSGSNKMNKVEAYKNDNKLLLADKLGHAKVSSLKEQNLINTINTVATHDTDITQLKTDMNKVRGAYVYKGTVETEFDLPLNNNSVGDVYNVFSTGMNYAWNGENWDELGYNNLETKLKTWTTEQIGRATSLCEERLRFDPVPVYDVTLAEDVNITANSPYIISLGTGYHSCILSVFVPLSTSTPTVWCYVKNGDTLLTQTLFYTATNTGEGLWGIYSFIPENGYLIGKRVTANHSYSVGTYSILANITYADMSNSLITAITIAPSSGTGTLLAGTKFALYVASPDQRVTDVFGTELEEVTSEQIHSLFV